MKKLEIKTQELLLKINKKHMEIMEACPHEIVFACKDNHSRNMIYDERYYCPSCGMTIKCLDKNELMKTSFKSSRIIPLTDLSLSDSEELYNFIKNEVYNNMNLYYNDIIPTEQLSLIMEELLKDSQDHLKILKK